MITLTHLFVIFIWYAFGWLGSFLLLLMTIFSVNVIYKTLHLENETNIKNWFRKIVAWLYDYFDFDWTRDDLNELYLSFPVVCIMAAIAVFGTYTVPVSLVLSFIVYGVVLLWSSTKNK